MSITVQPSHPEFVAEISGSTRTATEAATTTPSRTR